MLSRSTNAGLTCRAYFAATGSAAKTTGLRIASAFMAGRSLLERTLAEERNRGARAFGGAAMEHVEAASRHDAAVDLRIVMAALHQPFEIEIVAVHIVMDEDRLRLALRDGDQFLAARRLRRKHLQQRAAHRVHDLVAVG